MENSHQCPSPFNMLPSEAPMATDSVGGSFGNFPRMHNGQLVPLKAPNQKTRGSDEPAIDLEDESRATNPSTATSSSASEEYLATFEANIEQAYLRKVSTSRDFPTVKQQKSALWYDALMKKKDALEKIVQAQTTIQLVEDEVAEHLTRETIARLRSRFFKIEDESTPIGRYVSTLSDVLIVPS